ncbi:hypothetical protein SDC9_117804 [bioreactor metagenome]|uniref:Uncharacterized protein n=1 Tax=bioreactor metagenome TaxID=1076179 RepID=A0A645C685_9ZZZZ
MEKPQKHCLLLHKTQTTLLKKKLMCLLKPLTKITRLNMVFGEPIDVATCMSLERLEQGNQPCWRTWQSMTLNMTKDSVSLIHTAILSKLSLITFPNQELMMLSILIQLMPNAPSRLISLKVKMWHTENLSLLALSPSSTNSTHIPGAHVWNTRCVTLFLPC